MTDEFALTIKEILNKAGLDISVEQIEAGLNVPGEEIPIDVQWPDDVIRKIEEDRKEKGGQTEEGFSFKGTGGYRVMSGRVELEYSGRAHKKYHGDAILLIKPDDSLVVHGMRGVKPMSYISGADDIRFKGKEGKLTVTAVAGSDRLIVTFLKMSAFKSLFENWQRENTKLTHDRLAKDEIILTEEEKALEARLRKLRIELAHRDGISFLSAVYDNRTMNRLVRQRPKTIEELRQIRGFGTKRIERYGASVLETINGSAGDLANA